MGELPLPSVRQNVFYLHVTFTYEPLVFLNTLETHFQCFKIIRAQTILSSKIKLLSFDNQAIVGAAKLPLQVNFRQEIHIFISSSTTIVFVLCGCDLWQDDWLCGAHKVEVSVKDPRRQSGQSVYFLICRDPSFQPSFTSFTKVSRTFRRRSPTSPRSPGALPASVRTCRIVGDRMTLWETSRPAIWALIMA